jgi:hypothetical protein
MNLSQATTLLGPQARYFSEVYKLFRYTDDQLLKAYLDFIVHEPVEWLKGFPTKYTSKNSFSRPKTAVLKLLKEPSVIAALGEEYTTGIHDTIWTTFKKHSDAIVEGRTKTSTVEPPTLEEEECVEAPLLENFIEFTPVVPPVKESAEPSPWEAKYRLLESAYLDLLNSLEATQPGLVASTRRLLAALTSSTCGKYKNE